MLKINYHTSFKRDYKRLAKRGYDLSLLDKAIEILANDGQLPPEYQAHNLSGNYNGFKECHIRPDWLLIYSIDNNVLMLSLSRTGTHSDLFV